MCEVKLLTHSQTSTVAQLKFKDKCVFLFHTLWWTELFVHAMIYVNPC